MLRRRRRHRRRRRRRRRRCCTKSLSSCRCQTQMCLFAFRFLLLVQVIFSKHALEITSRKIASKLLILTSVAADKNEILTSKMAFEPRTAS